MLTFDRSAWLPPERLSLSEWAERHYYLSAESSAEPGRFRPYAYQRGIMDAVTDPNIEQVTLIKSARVGFTKILNAVVGYYMVQDPCPILVVQPTVEDAEGYSKEEIAPMVRDCPSIARLFTSGGKAKTSADTILHKIFPGGSISMVGANSGRGFRRVSRKIVLFDEVDGYPLSAGTEGDPIRLGTMRTQFYWDRKILLGSTPTTSGKSRIWEAFVAGDQRYYHVPCPHCGHYDRLVFRREETHPGHFMTWPEGHPERAHFVCSDCGCAIEHASKREMVDAGEWRSTTETARHASFHIWAGYSLSPNAQWGQLAKEYDECNAAGAEKLKTFVNTVLGETFQERGDAPEWERLYNRREDYRPGTVPDGVQLLTAGVDVQKDRLVFEVVGWGAGAESWSIDHGELHGDTSDDATWRQLDALLARSFEGPSGEHRIAMLAVDSGYQTQVVYSWARKYPLSRVIAVKGSASAKVLIGTPSPVEVNVRGKRYGGKVWPVGSSIGKGELYGWLRLDRPEEGDPMPAGWCHFPEYGEEYFKQLTAEHMVSVVNAKGYTDLVWKKLPNRENHLLDCRVYARAAAALAGVDRMRATENRRVSAQPKVQEQAPEQVPLVRQEQPRRPKPRRTSSFWGNR